MIENPCTYKHKIRQARDDTAEETNVSRMSLDHACSLHFPVSHSNRLRADGLDQQEHLSCAQLCTHDILFVSHLLPLAFSGQVIESPSQRLENKRTVACLADTSDQCKHLCMVAEKVSKPPVFQ